MFKNFITLTYRHFVRSPLTSFIELFGLAAALTITILILLWVNNELSYDKFNANYDHIYRLETSTDRSQRRTLNMKAYADIIEENVPDVEKVVTTLHWGGTDRFFTINDLNQKKYFDLNALYTNQQFLETFSFEFSHGDPKTALLSKKAIILSERIATTLFPGIDPVGKTITDEDGNILSVTGVIKGNPNFHIDFDILYSFSSLEEWYGDRDWRLGHDIYLLMKMNVNLRQLQTKMSENTRRASTAL